MAAVLIGIVVTGVMAAVVIGIFITLFMLIRAGKLEATQVPAATQIQEFMPTHIQEFMAPQVDQNPIVEDIDNPNYADDIDELEDAA